MYVESGPITSRLAQFSLAVSERSGLELLATIMLLLLLAHYHDDDDDDNDDDVKTF